MFGPCRFIGSDLGSELGFIPSAGATEEFLGLVETTTS